MVCEQRPTRLKHTTPLLYLDATADSMVTNAYLGPMRQHSIDVFQTAVVTQVHDRTGSNSSWAEKVEQEKANLKRDDYDNQNNDVARLIVVLNTWVDLGEKPLLIGHKALVDFLKEHPLVHAKVRLAHFMSVRGSNDYKDCSVIFITGRNQPSYDAITRQAMSVFGPEAIPIVPDDPTDMPEDIVDYWLSERSNQNPSAIAVPVFSDPRVEAVHKQLRDSETLQSIARLRLVWSDYQKHVFLLSNLPIEMPVDHLVSFDSLLPDRLEQELLKQGDLPLTSLGMEQMRPDLGLTHDAIKSIYRRSSASTPHAMLRFVPALARASVQIATFKAGKVRKTQHQHMFLPKRYDGDPHSATYLPWTYEQVLEHLEAGWGTDAVTDLQVGYLHEGNTEIAGDE